MADITLPDPLDLSDALNQAQSPLFSWIPAEIRIRIFEFALTDFDGEPFTPHSYWYRPGYTARRRNSTSLLYTCKKIYFETWFMPLKLTEHVFFLTGYDRCSRQIPRHLYQQCLDTLHKRHGILEIPQVQLYAQLYMLEPGEELKKLFAIPHFYPKSINLTIRYTDFWFWERDARLWIDPKWVNTVRFPDSVECFTMEFEMVQRRREEVDIIAQQAAERWFFQRKDGAILTPRAAEMSVSTWSGSSLFGDERWVRDEVRPGQLDYHVVKLPWRLTKQTREQLNFPTPCPKIEIPSNYHQVQPRFDCLFLQAQYMELAEVQMDTPTDEAINRVQNLMNTRVHPGRRRRRH